LLSPACLRKRALLLQAIRDFFIEKDFLEVDTPLRLPSLIPEAHIEPVASGSWFLQTSPELCMKRLLAHGEPRIFQICKCFRAHEQGKRHLPEFTMLEWYQSGCDYFDLMADCRELLIFLVETLDISLPGYSFTSSWRKLPVAEAFKKYAKIELDEVMASGDFDEILVEQIEPFLGRKSPVFLYDYPAEFASLARLKKTDNCRAERFELYINGLELANGFSELTDPAEQRLRFTAEQELCRTLGREPQPMPEKLVTDLAAIDKAAGIALGIDRLAMVLWGEDNINDVVSFTAEDL
jgi:lysyl-tRNA synthetase class 2